MSPERQIEVEWHMDVAEAYPVKIRIRSLDRVGLLADIAAAISKNSANILSANTETHEDKTVDTYFSIGVESTEHLKRVLADLRKIRMVQEVRRIN
jgi:GTP pyrophosphokinase